MPKLQRPHEGFGSYFEGAGLLDDLNLTRILGYINEMLITIEGYRSVLHPVLMSTFILENLGRIDDFAKTFGRCIRESTAKALCGGFRSLLEWGDVDGWGLLC